MSATATDSTLNGKPQRKQLGDQLDRLDGIIDALADGLPGAVAQAAQEGTRQAVKDAIIEILTNPDLRALITGMAPSVPPYPTPDAPTAPGFWSRAKAKFQDAKNAVGERYRAAKTVVVDRCRNATTTVAMTALTLTAMMPLRKILLVGVGVGLVVGAVSFVCPHGLSAVIGGIGGACTAIAAQVANWFRLSARAFGVGGS
jgi:hypothetical protein